MAILNRAQTNSTVRIAVLALLFALCTACTSGEDPADAVSSSIAVTTTASEVEIAPADPVEPGSDGESVDESEGSTPTTWAERPELTPSNLRATTLNPRLIVLEWDEIAGAESYAVYRDDLFVERTTDGRLEDRVSPDNSYTYVVIAEYSDDLTGVAQISLSTPPEDETDSSIETVIQDAQSDIRSLGLGPIAYWTATPICQSCSYAQKTITAVRLQLPGDFWGLPAEHPGVMNPESVHEFLLEALANGKTVEAEFADNGVATYWTVDDYGMESDCFMYDTAPPDQVVETKQADPARIDSHCGFVGLEEP